MGFEGFSISELIIVIGVFALIIWRLVRASKKSSSSVTSGSSGSSGENTAYLAGRQLRRTIDNAYTNSRKKSDLEARGFKYDALAKLKALHENGVISDSEFEAEKSEILGR
ncbi:MAG TPA: SHOCT domain-containing protein [Pseudomonas sabulinigri]|uniref:SHOCT domain-containing protein n=1 Tax=marine sediment metagenome TaxID=412755 RepID=A0A0F9V5P1_9ZZZZ|nr:SHOCT domain-containing protein [Halopseudomonas sabulinigri]HEC51283.1 SHOCT domain-containing protein [Halopseudomonas sabulinigri]|tara:strand:- start:119 stop:451 length:333 start_codon:yes stop_codon:yes gene_type:complete